MHCFSKSLIVICRYHHFTHRAANHCCQSLRDTVKRTLKAGSHRNDYERIQLKTDLRLVKIIKPEGKPSHICLKNMVSNNFVELFFKIHKFSLF